MPALKNPKHEIIARQVASGLSDQEASADAGYDSKAKSFVDNARKRAQRHGIPERVAELKAPGIAKAEQQVGDWNEYICTRLHRIVARDVEEIKTTDQIAAMRLLAEMKGLKAPDKHELTGRDGAPFSLVNILTELDGSGRSLPANQGETERPRVEARQPLLDSG